MKPTKSAYIKDDKIRWVHECPYGKFEVHLDSDETCDCGDFLSQADIATIEKLKNA
tara:strand:- start:578 stop:745 length:168 start_codon:yes stop_codon:yes gene_type:complete